MTNKRFEVVEDMDFDIEYIKDSDTFKIISNFDSCCDMLNSLNDENGKLKRDKGQLKQFINELTSRDGRIWLSSGYVYDVKKVLKGNVE